MKTVRYLLWLSKLIIFVACTAIVIKILIQGGVYT